MLLYDGKENGRDIDIYVARPNHEAIKNFKKNAINNIKASDRFYKINSNVRRIVEVQERETVTLRDLQFDNYDPLSSGTWSDL